MTNISPISSAIDMVRNGRNQVELGIAGLAAGMVEAWETPMRAVVNPGKASEAAYFFSFSDMGAPRTKEDGEPEGRFMAAAYVAVAENFGTGELTGKDTQAFKRALRVAGSKLHMGLDVSFTPDGAAFPIAQVFPVTETVTVRDYVEDEDGNTEEVLSEVVNLTDLGAAMVEKIKETTKAVLGSDLSDEEARAKLLERKVVVNGKEDILTGAKTPVLSEFASKFAEPLTALGKDTFKPRAGRVALDKGALFLANVESIKSALALLLSTPEDGESEFAPCRKTNAELARLQDVIHDYFSSPLSEVEDVEPVVEVQPSLLPEQPEVPASGRRPAKVKVSNLD